MSSDAVPNRSTNPRYRQKKLDRQRGQQRAKARRSLSLTQWIALIFAIGSTFFALASLLFLMPQLGLALGLSNFSINLLFFIGSLPFSIAAYLQLYQSANSDTLLRDESFASVARVWIGYQPQNLAWLSSVLQFLGTLLFNINTFDALLPGLNWLEEDLMIWAPNIAGSLLFFSSGYLAFVDCNRGRSAFRPWDAQWRIAATNLLGCVGFFAAACCAIYWPSGPNAGAEFWALLGTLAGALCFFFGASLLYFEERNCIRSQEP